MTSSNLLDILLDPKMDLLTDEIKGYFESVHNSGELSSKLPVVFCYSGLTLQFKITFPQHAIEERPALFRDLYFLSSAFNLSCIAVIFNANYTDTDNYGNTYDAPGMFVGIELNYTDNYRCMIHPYIVHPDTNKFEWSKTEPIKAEGMLKDNFSLKCLLSSQASFKTSITNAREYIDWLNIKSYTFDFEDSFKIAYIEESKLNELTF